jgi:hypothetical protein
MDFLVWKFTVRKDDLNLYNHDLIKCECECVIMNNKLFQLL